jgi:phosphoglycolate phosphatase
LGKYTTIIFDLDGTLLNTLDDLVDSVNYVMTYLGFPGKSRREVRNYVGNGMRRLMELSLPQNVDPHQIEQAFSIYRDYYTEHCRVKTKPYGGILELLGTLKKSGYKMAIVSNKNDAAVRALRDIYFSEYIETAIGEKENIRKKPAPDTVLQALKELNSSKGETLYIGDSEVDKQTADNAGMQCVLVSWGFRDKEQLETLMPAGVIDSPLELLDFL